MIDLKNICKPYIDGTKVVTALNNVTATFDIGEFVLVTGASGSGKTTLLNCIGGLDNATGMVQINDLKFNKTSAAFDKFRSKNIGIVYQEFNLIENKSVRDNLQLAIDIARTSTDDDEQRIRELLNLVGMDKYLKRKICTLSGGQKQRVAIARALINDPCIILADEPTGHLDTQNTIAIMDILKQLSYKILIVWVSHEKKLVNSYADRVIELDHGRVTTDSLNISESNAEELPISEEAIYRDEYDSQTVVLNKVKAEIYTKSSKAVTIQLFINDNRIYINAPSGVSIEEIGAESIKDTKERAIRMRSEPTQANLQIPQAKYTGKKRRGSRDRLLRIDKKSVYSIVAFVIAAIFLATAMSFVKLNGVEEYEFLSFDRNTVQIDGYQEFTTLDIEQIMSIEGVQEILPYHTQFSFNIKDGSFIQSHLDIGGGLNFMSSILSTNQKIVLSHGRLPQNNFEVVLDEMVIAKLLDEKISGVQKSTTLGYTNIVNFLNTKIPLNETDEFTVVGISNNNSPTIYVTDEMIVTLCLSHSVGLDYAIYTDLSIAGVSELPKNGIYVHESLMVYNQNELVVGGKKFDILGTFNSNSSNSIVMNMDDANAILWSNYLNSTQTLLVLCDNPDEVAYELCLVGYNANSAYDIYRNTYEINIKRAETVRKVIAAVILIIATVIYWMTEKSKIGDRIGDISIKRYLGATKSAIFGTLILESMLTMLVFVVPAYLLTVLLIGNIASQFGSILAINVISISNTILGIVLLLLIACCTTFVSCLVFLNKTTAELGKKDGY